MVKKFSACLALFLALTMLCCVTAFADQRVYDDADLFSDDEEYYLESAIADFINSSGQDMYVLTAAEGDDSYGSARDRADYFLLDMGYGNSDDGAILYLIDMEYRQDYLSTAGVMIDYITDYRRDDIFSDTKSYLQSGDFYGAADTFVRDTVYWYEQGIPDGQHRTEESGENSFTLLDAVITLVLAAAGFFIPLFIIKGSYELKGSTYSYDYNSNSKVNLTGRSDQYLRTTVIRTPKPQDNDSDSSSTHDTGGGTFGGGDGNHF